MLYLYNEYSNYLYDKKGPEVAYAEVLKAEFYEKRLDKVLKANISKIVSTTEVSNQLIQDYHKDLLLKLDDFGSEMIDGISYINENIEGIGDQLENVNSHLLGISGILELGFFSVIENIRVTNVLLHDVTLLLKIPDFEKERCLYIEEA